MTMNPRPDHNRDHQRHYRVAIEDAKRLCQPRPAGGYSPGWSVQAAHVGDLSVLALALRD
jgi:hypothetical protein